LALNGKYSSNHTDLTTTPSSWPGEETQAQVGGFAHDHAQRIGIVSTQIGVAIQGLNSLFGNGTGTFSSLIGSINSLFRLLGNFQEKPRQDKGFWCPLCFGKPENRGIRCIFPDDQGN
jgi:hypothetical protein